MFWTSSWHKCIAAAILKTPVYIPWRGAEHLRRREPPWREVSRFDAQGPALRVQAQPMSGTPRRAPPGQRESYH